MTDNSHNDEQHHNFSAEQTVMSRAEFLERFGLLRITFPSGREGDLDDAVCDDRVFDEKANCLAHFQTAGAEIAYQICCAAVAAERERCARAVEQYGGAWDATTQNFARLIRGLGPNVFSTAPSETLP